MAIFVLLALFLMTEESAIADRVAEVDEDFQIQSAAEADRSLIYPPSSQRQPPKKITDCLVVIQVNFYNDMNKLSTGTMVVNKDLAKDVSEIFKLIESTHYPVHSVVPVSDSSIGWSDEASMQIDNSSSYNYRLKTSGNGLSWHASGRAVDINTKCNPYVYKNGKTDPPGATYDPRARCALSMQNEKNRQIIQAFLDRGWKWGGNFEGNKDYQHFEKGVVPGTQDDGQISSYCKSAEESPAAPNPSSTEPFTAQLGAFKNKTTADTLAAQNPGSYVEPTTSEDGTTLYRVRSGTFSTRDEAEQYCDKMSSGIACAPASK